MATSFFFYDLETSGINPRDARIMQFAGQRTDMDLNFVGDPVNILIKLTDDVVPDPDAILITGITPQQTISDGITEAEFLKIFHTEVAVAGTIFVGYNTVRFDDEFMRYLHYRNFYDPYEWQYTENKSRWDLLDVVRMTRALRPQGIEWPVDEAGKPTNRLELLTKANNISHKSAHDALNDVHATIEIARLIQKNQPKLFDFLLKLRDKKAVGEIVTSGQPFVYSSGKYANEFQKTTVVGVLADHPKRQGSLVFDLRYDPTEFSEMSVDEIVEAWQWKKDEGIRLPIKTLQYNRCPAVAPLAVMDEASQQRLGVDMAQIKNNFQKLKSANLSVTVLKALEKLDAKQQANWSKSGADVDAQLYDGFLDAADKSVTQKVRTTSASEISSLNLSFKDNRLTQLLPLYKARNFPSTLSDEDRLTWESFREQRLLGGKQQSRMAKFFARLAELAAVPDLSADKQYLLEELHLYGQSIMPVIED